MYTQQNKLVEEQVYRAIFEDVKNHKLYDKRYFSNYEGFKKFCEEDFSNESSIV